jgi:hypothetical protein
MTKAKRELVTPKCCPEIQDCKLIIAVVDWPDCDLRGETSADIPPRWAARMFEHEDWVSRHTRTMSEKERKKLVVKHEDGSETWPNICVVDKAPDPKFCPFCGTPLPKLVKKKRPPKVQLVEDGGYYCSTCGERIRSCECPYPEQAYEPERKKA